MGGAVAAEQVLAGRARRDEADAQLAERRRDQRERLEQRRQGTLQLPGGRERSGQRHEQRQPVTTALGHQPQRGGEPADRAGRSAGGRLVPGGDQQRARGLVADLGAALDMVCARRERASAPLQRGRGTRVRSQPPALAGGLVDRATHERMPEPVSARDVRRRQQVRRHELVERRERDRLLELRRRGRQLEVRRIAGDRRAVREQPSGLAQRRDLVPERRGHRRRHAGDARRRPAHGGARAGELQQVERIAAAHAAQLVARPRGDILAEKIAGLSGRQRGETEVDEPAVTVGGLERGRDRRRQPAGAEGESEQHRRTRRPPQQVYQQLERSPVGPVKIVQDHDDRAGRGDALEKRADGAMRSEALVRQPCGSILGPGRRQHVGELADSVGEHPPQPIGPEPGDVVVERIDPDAERQVALELRAATVQDEVPALFGARHQLFEQPGLADPRLALERHEPARALRESLHRLRERGRLLPAAHQGPGAARHLGTTLLPRGRPGGPPDGSRPASTASLLESAHPIHRRSEDTTS